MKARFMILVLAAYTVALGALAQMGEPVLAYIFFAALIIQVIVHVIWLCPRCINMDCTINPKSPDFLFGRGDGKPNEGAKPMNTSFAILVLGVTFLIGLAGVWYFNPLAWMAMFPLGVVLIYMYSRGACKMCRNICLMRGKRGSINGKGS